MKIKRRQIYASILLSVSVISLAQLKPDTVEAKSNANIKNVKISTNVIEELPSTTSYSEKLSGFVEVSGSIEIKEDVSDKTKQSNNSNKSEESKKENDKQSQTVTVYSSIDSSKQEAEVNTHENVIVDDEPTNTATAVVTENYNQNNTYPVGQCTWGAKVLAPWAHNYWGNAGEWAYNAKAAGFKIGTKPVVGAIAVWTGGYGHVAVVTEINGNLIRVKESNYNGNQYIADFRGWFNPNYDWSGAPSAYIYPPGT